MSTLKFGILSTAKIGRTQVIPAIQRSKNGEAVAIASRNIETARDAAKELSIEKAYDTYESLLEDPDIDAVYIPLPNALHKEWIMKACKQKKHVLCEKPISLNSQELAEITATAKENNVMVMEAFMYQFHPQHSKVKEIIANGEIGEVSLMRASFSFYLEDHTNIRLNNDLGGGSMYDVGCYTLHSIRNIFNQEPSSVYASSTSRSDLQVDTTMSGVLTFPDGKLGLFDSSFDSYPRQNYEVVGSMGTINVTSSYRPDTNENMEGEIIIKKNNGGQVVHKVAGDQYKLMVEDFADAILSNRALTYSETNMVNQMKVLEAVYKSSRENCAVSL
ncbi:Predicted dehydrogenase [Gracilibacillus ureilyticus]|uniref:Predicted dehydrogenase n=1 Tax=Gracilibacillus ureilyticus TaxID=531814 RepID=A0A1H9PX64_9BACI|nr:Gfo/Idh/MocA family oxidoreductase [Gracilibacillus ureilyticus]SER52203.1 Predicted dehydrogenase [Gracilibacillus ureilyticus]